MNKWLVSFGVSFFVTVIFLGGLTVFLAQDRCLDGGGSWLGVLAGCDGAMGYDFQALMSVEAFASFIGILLGVASAFIQIHKLISQFRNDKT